VTQVLVNSLIYASEIAVIALGISLSYSILRFANFAHIQFAVVGGYLTYVFAVMLGLPLIVATAISVVLTGCLAIVVDHLVFRRIRHASAEGKMIASWGVALFMRSIVAAIFGGSALVFNVEGEIIRAGGAIFTTLDVAVVAVTAASMVILHLVLQKTRAGTALRALASNFELAETRGIPSGRMIRLMWFMTGAYAALGGTLFAVETQLKPNMDLMILLPVFAAVTIGGLGSVYGAVAGALILSLFQNLLISVDFGALIGGDPWYVPSQFRDYVAVCALVLVLLLRPGGLAGLFRKAGR
jgi:branched-subunit amino acid ABC-type transport system permease component